MKRLEKAYQERSVLMTLLRINPRFASFHSDPRFQLRRIGLAP
jgi:hypothetical protein